MDVISARTLREGPLAGTSGPGTISGRSRSGQDRLVERDRALAEHELVARQHARAPEPLAQKPRAVRRSQVDGEPRSVQRPQLDVAARHGWLRLAIAYVNPGRVYTSRSRPSLSSKVATPSVCHPLRS